MDIREFHWLANIIQALDVGLVVIDLENRVQIWNGFMESHSGKLSNEVKDRDLFDIYPTLDQAWLERKLAMVRTLNTPALLFPGNKNRICSVSLIIAQSPVVPNSCTRMSLSCRYPTSLATYNISDY
jgi:PAS fold.